MKLSNDINLKRPHLIIVDNLTENQEIEINKIIAANKNSIVHYWVEVEGNSQSQLLWIESIILLSKYLNKATETLDEFDMDSIIKQIFSVSVNIPILYELQKTHEESCEVCQKNSKEGHHVH